jgi:Uma2 family endonuclease
MVIPVFKPLEPIEYPESDGKPVAETQVHVNIIFALISVLTQFFRNAIDVYVAGNMMFYFDEGDPSACVAPDVFVVKKLDKNLRRTYKLWEEKQAPSVIFEITSKSTKFADGNRKRELYANLGVQEYFLFDPLSEYLSPSLQGFRLAGGRYEMIRPDAEGALLSQELGLKMLREGVMLRLIEIATSEKLLMHDEIYAELERVRDELAKMKGKQK